MGKRKVAPEFHRCRRCNKTNDESPARRFADGSLVGWCIACEREHEAWNLARIAALPPMTERHKFDE